tara:strand:+ start:15849 stop:16622 length:774 start_codon:yes stop_codon:yes gene_type:complete
MSVVEDDEEFISARIKKRFKGKIPKVVKDSDSFSAGVLGNKVRVTGEEVARFVRAYEEKLSKYLSKPFLRVLVDGSLLRGMKNFRKYVLGAAICKHYDLPCRRFIEVQFYFHDDWKGSAPTIHYVTSLDSGWNSVGRYKDYCSRFKNEIDYFDDGVDNVDPAYYVPQAVPKDTPVKQSLVRVYEDMIAFQMGAVGKSRKEVLRIIGKPGKNYLPFKYLKDLCEYRELVSEDAWGFGPYKFDYYQKLKNEIENITNER